jgi:HlyD family secretion protein
MKRSRLLWMGMIPAAAALAAAIPWQARPQVAYLTQPVERGDLLSTLTATGQLNAVTTVTVGSQESGQIAELLVDFNDVVEKGQPIARLDPSTFAARVRQAKAEVEEARATVVLQRSAVEKARIDLQGARTKREVAVARVANARAVAENSRRDLRRKELLVARATLAPAAGEDASTEYQSMAALLRAAEAEREVADQAVPAAAAGVSMAEATLQHAHAAIEQKLAALEQANIDLARTVIRAPIRGAVIDRSVEPGQTVAAALEAPTLFTLAYDLREMEVHAKVDEADIGRVRLGQKARFGVDAYPDRVFEASVGQIRKAADVIENVVTYTVVLKATNADLALFPGMTALVRILVERAANVLKIPNAALRYLPAGEPAAGAKGGALIWIVDESGNPVPVEVTLGRSDADSTELVEGPLREGQRVIVGTAPLVESGSWFGLHWTM